MDAGGSVLLVGGGVTGGVKGGEGFDDRVMLKRLIMSSSFVEVLTGAGGSGRANVLLAEGSVEPDTVAASLRLAEVAFTSLSADVL